MAGPADWSRIRRAKEAEVESLRALPLGEITPSRRDFSQFIGSGRGDLGLVAALRRRDPYTGVTWDDLDPAAAAAALDDSDIVALAVTTEAELHAGRLADVAAAAGAATAPILRDDPLLHPLQVYQSRMHGADACVIAVGWTSDETLAEAVRVARSLHMTSVLAVAHPDELARALDLDHVLVGLMAQRADGSLDADLVARLAARVPSRCSVLLLGDVPDAALLAALPGVVDAALVARVLMGRSDLTRAIEELETRE
jgi:indole-3-glycerol phosphate synthase